MNEEVESADGWITPTPARPAEASNRFRGLDASVLEFWRFALGDLRMNNARGYLAEFIVSRALGLDAQRVEWAEYDVLYEGIKIEVKSSAYLQSWEQPRLSRIIFSGLMATKPERGGSYKAPDKQFNADVYVFCVQTAKTHEQYDALDVDQWTFYVLPRSVLVVRGFASIALSELEKLTHPLRVSGLRAAILAATPS